MPVRVSPAIDDMSPKALVIASLSSGVVTTSAAIPAASKPRGLNAAPINAPAIYMAVPRA